MTAQGNAQGILSTNGAAHDNALGILSTNGAAHDSPGQRPGYVSLFPHSPEGAA